MSRDKKTYELIVITITVGFAIIAGLAVAGIVKLFQYLFP